MLNIWNTINGSFTYLILLTHSSTMLASELQFKGTKKAIAVAKNSFVTPSGNIHCAVVGETKKVLRCEIRSRIKPLPPQPYSGYCQFDWGAGFSLSRRGKPTVLCISDTISGSNYTLNYGSTWRYLDFWCTSRKTGLVCTNSSGNGFSLNRNRSSAF
jgi:hypothetical protein